MDFAWKEVLPVVKVGEKHDPAEEEGDEHEEAVHHINQAVLQQNWVKIRLATLWKLLKREEWLKKKIWKGEPPDSSDGQGG